MKHFEALRPHRYYDIEENYEFVHGKDSLCVYDLKTLDFVKEIPVGPGADCHATTASNRYVYLACLDGVYIIDQRTLEVAKVLPLGEVYATNSLPDKNTMLIHDNHGGIYVLRDIDDMDKVHVYKHLQLLTEADRHGKWIMLGGKGYFLPGDRYYVCAGWRSGKEFIIDTLNYTWEEYMPYDPILELGDDLVMTTDRKTAYIACHRGYDPAHVAVVDLERKSVVKVIPTGHGTCGLTMTNDERYVIASNDKDDTISVIDTQTQEVCNTLSANAAFRQLGLNTATFRASASERMTRSMSTNAAASARWCGLRTSRGKDALRSL